jgi:DNA-binding SARP family transcriptional activator
MIEIRLLGELEVQRDGATVPLPPSKKSRALLAYLVATGRPQMRDRICELLWEGPDNPRAELRWSLTKLRPLLDSHLIADREHIEFRAEGVTVDLQQFRRMIGRGIEHASVHDLYRAVQLVRGELLEGLDLPSCYRFQQWLVGERESLRQLHVGALARLADRLGPGDEALVYARRRAMVDPFSEEAHIALIQTLAALGRNQEALTQYEHCRMLFERELTTLPSEAVEDARRRIGKSTSSSRPAVEESRPRLSSDGPLVGRKREREQLERAIASPDKVVLISGEPGIGKSRLLADMCAQMRARGGRALYGRAFAAEMIRPYGIWIDALAELGSLSGDNSDRSRLFEGVVETLRKASRGGVVIALDDLQWLDEASAALLHYVARALRGEPILIALGARTGELEANAAAARVIHELGRDQRLLQLSLEPLTAEETRTLTERVATPAEIDRIVTESGGNPLFAIELARSSTSGGPLPETLEQVLSDRLAQLDLRARELVPWAAALGRHFDVEILGRATGMPSGEMMAALETLERCAIFRATGSASGYDFSHDLIRHAAYQKLSGPRKWLVHRQIAQALQATHDPDGALAGEIVHHASLAGDPHLASTAACAAGQRCLRLFAYSEALAVARQGLQIADALPDDVRIGIQLELLSVIVISRTSVKERVLWQPRIETLLEEARKRRLVREASLAAHLLALLHAEREDFRGAANRTLESAEIIREADPATAAARIANTGRCLVFIQRDVQRGRLLLTEAETLAAQSGVEHVEIPLGLGYYFAHVGEESRAIPELERAYSIAAREQDHWREWIAVVRLVTLALECPDPEAALRHAERLAAIAAKMTGGSEGPVTEVLTTLARMISGETVDIERSFDLLRQIDSKGDLAYALTYLAESDLQRGDSDSARRHADEALVAAELVDRASEAAVARSLLAEITGNRSFIDPILATAAWDDLTKRAQDRLMRAAARLNIRPQPRKERKHGTHRPRTVI